MNSAITVEGLSKQYLLGSEIDTSLNFREMLASSFKSPFRRFRRLRGTDDKQKRFWALKDISFEVQPGEIVGVIGRNGAGKSTLLKVLSRITTPTAGIITYRGRLASLLEVGTGFHPELTGRENIFLNGAILGMSRQEISKWFDPIVEFAGIEKFLDTPVKRFSSGMYIRLAFSVAAHLEPDILLVDEVLAVGDTEFQKRCLGKMGEVSASGRTVIFVSHNLDAVQRICSRSLLLNEGVISFAGKTSETISQYLSRSHLGVRDSELASTTERWGSGLARIQSVMLYDHNNQESTSVFSGRPCSFLLGISKEQHGRLRKLVASLSLKDERGTTVLLVSSLMEGHQLEMEDNKITIVCSLDTLAIAAGNYTVTLYLGTDNGETYDCLNDIVMISVIGGDFFGTGHPGFPDHCKTLTRSDWQVD